ncbi:hypothetical protein [Catenuloplanes atrovinosus]|uniref:Uncharacterized protein n=1 Tax=Catenuloplanes atrovinosus TaxID=137266 RepID=A0AAE3YPW7_9ACTN|nr:hypothetical protein [Catenuloplanes atrovinosus]MDR7275631.1 hypothetical protein [Catenuloplanes atrovinosus]
MVTDPKDVPRSRVGLRLVAAAWSVRDGRAPVPGGLWRRASG